MGDDISEILYRPDIYLNDILRKCHFFFCYSFNFLNHFGALKNELIVNLLHINCKFFIIKDLSFKELVILTFVVFLQVHYRFEIFTFNIDENQIIKVKNCLRNLLIGIMIYIFFLYYWNQNLARFPVIIILKNIL